MFFPSVFLEIIIAQIVFLLGVPAIVYQIIVSGEKRRIIKKYTYLYELFYSVVVINILIFLLYIWIYHIIDQSIITQVDTCYSNATLSINFLINLVFLWYVLIRISTNYIITVLEMHVINHYQKYDILEEEAVNDLIFLGKNVDSYYYKEIVLHALNNIIIRVTHNNYTGCELVEILNNIKYVIVSSPYYGDDNNYLLLSSIYNSISISYKTNQTKSSADLFTAINQLCLLTTESINLNKSSNIISTFIELNSEYYENIYVINKYAFENEHYSYSLQCLNNYESLLANAEVQTDEMKYYYFGILSYFYNDKYPSMIQRAKESLKLFIDSGVITLSSDRTKSIEYFQSIAEFKIIEGISKVSL